MRSLSDIADNSERMSDMPLGEMDASDATPARRMKRVRVAETGNNSEN